MIRVAARLLVAAALAGCVVDVDLGDTPDGRTPMPDPTGSSDGAGPDADPAPDIDPTPDADPPPDVDPPPDAAPRPDAAGTDAEPDAAPEPFDDCAACVEALAESAECVGEADCVLDPELADTCEALCGAPGTAECADCEARLLLLLEQCFEHAPPAACEQLAQALELECAFACRDAPCAECLDGIGPFCPDDPPLGCGFALYEGFDGCFPVCEEPALSAGRDCAFEVGETWSLCRSGSPAPCDAALSIALDACRGLVTEGCAACAARIEADRQSCASLGFEPDHCVERGLPVDRACAADCVGAPFERCAIGAEAAAATCRTVGGDDCEPLRETILGACLFAEPPVDACLDCLSSGLAAWEICGADDFECLFAFRDGWQTCLDGCGGAAPVPECFDCAADADAALARCLLGGEALAECLSSRAAAATECADLCGDAVPRAAPCSVRAAALAELCFEAQPDEDCFIGVDLLGAACRWTRVGWD